MNRKFTVVVGATGVIGSNLIEYLHALDDWGVIGIARKVPFKNSERYVAMALLNLKDIPSKVEKLTP